VTELVVLIVVSRRNNTEMPVIKADELGIAVDLKGCPNRCRHCYLGSPAKGTLSSDDFRWAVGQFREFVSSGENTTQIRRLAVASWCYEPDYAENYRDLYEIEKELGDTGPYRYELLSVWRLARDASYAGWAKEIGPDTCQISFFGMEETTDWFYRRKGAFRDALTATERLLEVGMKPRWQLFLTTRVIREMADFLKMVERLRLRERVAALGGRFDLFLHTPGPDGCAVGIETIRPTLRELKALPAEIVETARAYFGEQELRWRMESELLSEIARDGDGFPYAYSNPERLWMVIKSNWDVFTNVAACDEWWKIGNLRADSVATIVERFTGNDCPGLHTIYSVPPGELAERYGNPEGERIYSSKDDLLSLYVGRYCREITSSFSPRRGR
jgi:hypothetical protein